jgi:hypothetical protein
MMSGVMGAGMDAETVRCEATYARLMPIDNRDAGRLGKAVEHLVAATCILTSGLELNVSTSFGDDEGVDLVFARRGHPKTLAVQVTSRRLGGSSMSKGTFRTQVRYATFAERGDR